MPQYNINIDIEQDYRFNFLISLEIGLMRLVRLALRACRTLVLARVFFMRWDWAMFGAAEQSFTAGTVRPRRGPDSQRQRSFGPLGVRFHTMRCSVTNSLALTV